MSYIPLEHRDSKETKRTRQEEQQTFIRIEIWSSWGSYTVKACNLCLARDITVLPNAVRTYARAWFLVWPPRSHTLGRLLLRKGIRALGGFLSSRFCFGNLVHATDTEGSIYRVVLFLLLCVWRGSWPRTDWIGGFRFACAVCVSIRRAWYRAKAVGMSGHGSWSGILLGLWMDAVYLHDALKKLLAPTCPTGGSSCACPWWHPSGTTLFSPQKIFEYLRLKVTLKENILNTT